MSILGIEVRPLAKVSFLDGLAAWNDGFEGYTVPIRMDMAMWLDHMVAEGLSPQLSVVAFDGRRPVGCVLSGLRRLADRTVAYNGGTGVAIDYRGQGIGRRMVEASILRCREAGADLATLEVIDKNASAIALYERVGYERAGRVLVLRANAPSDECKAVDGIELLEADVAEVAKLPYYHAFAPWQCQWQSLRDGRAILANARDGRQVGYTLVRRGGDGSTVGIFQAAVDPRAGAPETVLRAMVHMALRGARSAYAMNIDASDALLLGVLAECGFREEVAQLAMRLDLRAGD